MLDFETPRVEAVIELVMGTKAQATATLALLIMVGGVCNTLYAGTSAQPTVGPRLALPSGSAVAPAVEVRLRRLRAIAADTVGWNTSHIGPIRSVKMDRLRGAYLKTTNDDIALLLRLLAGKTLDESTHQAVKYLIAMHGQSAIDELDRTASEHSELRGDYSDIREYMKSRPWQSVPP